MSIVAIETALYAVNWFFFFVIGLNSNKLTSRFKILNSREIGRNSIFVSDSGTKTRFTRIVAY